MLLPRLALACRALRGRLCRARPRRRLRRRLDLRLRVAGNRGPLRRHGDTRGATHDTFVGVGPLEARGREGGGRRARLRGGQIPASQFVTRGRRTRYDRTGDFQGDVILKNATRPGGHGAHRVPRRAGDLGGVRAATCACSSRRDGCARGRACAVQPAAADGVHAAERRLRAVRGRRFGALARPTKRPQNPLCGLAIDTSKPCDFLIDERCILPYPSSYFLAADGSTPTGLRSELRCAGRCPKNTSNTYIDPTDWNTLDGFSPGPVILSLFPDTGFPVDLTASNVAFHTNFARSLDATTRR
jgi:hypothetical protein